MKKLDLLTLPLDRQTLIEASAGTGKTFTISNLFLRLILEQGYDVRTLLVVTFTEAATKELRDRIRKKLIDALAALKTPDACSDPIIQAIMDTSRQQDSDTVIAGKLNKALICFDEASIFTIHGFCQKILTDNSFESSILFDTELVTDQTPLIREITEDFWRIHLTDAELLIAALLKNNNTSIDALIQLMRPVLNKPGLLCLPEQTETPHDIAQRLNQCFIDLKTLWKESGDDIREILQTSSSLKRAKNTYREDKLPGYFESIDRLFGEIPAPDSLKILTLFSASAITTNTKAKKTPPTHLFFDTCDTFATLQSDYMICLYQSYFGYLKDELQKRKKQNNTQSFDDLLTSVNQALLSESGHRLADAVANNYQAALIDEFQDTDTVQYNIFNTIFAKKNKPLFLIGDPKQSIYGFRGADIFSYITAAAHIPDDNAFTLNENWRSETGMVDACNTLFNRAETPFVLGDAIHWTDVTAAKSSVGNQAKLHIDTDPESHLFLWYMKKENPTSKSKHPGKEEAGAMAVAGVVTEISRLLYLAEQGKAVIGKTPLKPSDFAILVIRNKDAETVKSALTSQGIPAVISKSGNIFHSDETLDLLLFLHAVAAPGNKEQLNTALATDLMGFSANEIYQFMASDDSDEDFQAYDAHMEKMADYHTTWQKTGFAAMFRQFMADYDVRKTLLALPNGERKLTNILHMSELINTVTVEKKLGISGAIGWINRQITSDEMNETHELRLERDDEAVQIVTVFKSKGLQYPIVFCPFMWQRGAETKNQTLLFHENNSVFWDMGSHHLEQNRHKATRESLAELIRLLYVAVTRAQNRCYLTYGKIGTPSANALDYILTGGEPDQPKVVDTIKQRLKALDEDQLYDRTIAYTDNANGLIHVACDPLPTKAFPVHRPDAEEQLQEKAFTNQDGIKNNRIIASFSMLTSGKKGADYGQKRPPEPDEPARRIIPPEPEQKMAFAAFPGGTEAGSCIHDIFEHIDFSMTDKALNAGIIQTTLADYAFDPAFCDLVTGKVEQVLSTPLVSETDEIRLSDITPDMKLPEMEFYYPMSRLTQKTLQGAFAVPLTQNTERYTRFTEQLETLDFSTLKGYMRGFIDLIFCHNNRYYIIDWKTNNLGSQYPDYAHEHLEENMRSSLYFLQYHIYTVALHKYLSQRLQGYDYDTHFGGVFYLYIRGMSPESPETGIYYDKPPRQMTDTLCRLFDVPGNSNG